MRANTLEGGEPVLKYVIGIAARVGLVLPQGPRRRQDRNGWQAMTRHVADGGTVTHWREGELHREDGPAVEYPSGVTEYWLHGRPQAVILNPPLSNTTVVVTFGASIRARAALGAALQEGASIEDAVACQPEGVRTRGPRRDEGTGTTGETPLV